MDISGILKLLKNKGFILSTLILLSFQVKGQNSIKLIGDIDANATLVFIKNLNSNKSPTLYFPSDSGFISFQEKLPITVKVIANGFKDFKDTVYKNKTAINLNPSFTSIPKLILTGQPFKIEAENTTFKIKTISKRKLQAMAAVNLNDALTNEINITVSQDGQLGSGLSLRGISGQQIKILIDGVPVIGRNDGSIDLSQINLNNVDHIEIIEGPMSIIYGTDAAGGIINIISSRPEKEEKSVALQQLVGFNGTFNTFGSFTAGNKKNQFNINGTRFLFQGYDEDPEVRNQLWKPKKQWVGDLFYQRYFNQQFKQSFKINYFNEFLVAKGTPIVTPFEAVALDNYYTTGRLNLVGLSNFRSKNNKIKLGLTNAYNIYARIKDAKVTNLENLTQQNSLDPEARDTQIFDAFNSRLIGLAQLSKPFALGFGYDINIEKGKGRRISDQSNISDYAVYYNLKYRTNKLSIEQGLRVSYNNQFNIPLIPALHIRYKLSPKQSFSASAATGYRAPSIKERYLVLVDQNHDVVGNANLKPENSISYSLGHKYNLESSKQDLSTNFNAFYTSIQDLIILAALDPNSTSFIYQNINSFYTQGLNIGLNYGRKNLEINFGIGVIGTKQNGDSTQSVDKFLYRNEIQTNISYNFNSFGTTISLLNKYTGATPNYYLENSTLKLQYSTPFIMSDISAMHTFASKKLTLVATVKNLFDIKSIQNTASIGGPHRPTSNSAAIAMGRYFTINALFNINFEK